MRPRFEDQAAGAAYDTGRDGRLLVLFGSRLGGLIPRQNPWGFVRSSSGTPSSRLFLRDHQKAWFTAGVREAPSFGALQDLIGLIADGHDRTTLFGNSMGGFAALLYGRALGLPAVAINPQTFLSQDLRKAHGDGRWADDLDRLPPGPRDVLDFSEATARIIYSAGSGLDVVHAERVAGLLTTLDPRPGDKHEQLAPALAASGELAGLLS